MTRIRFQVEWPGESGAGIRAGSETVEIKFEHGMRVDTEDIVYWTQAVKDYFDGAHVELLATVEA